MKAEQVKNMFNEIAHKYDFMNNIISLGLHKMVKKLAIKRFKLPQNSKVLDLCCGTGDISYFLSQKKEVKEVVGLDFSENMLKVANEKNKNEKIEYILSDCRKLPVVDNEFDAVTMCFGLRNIEDKKTVIDEIKRVLKSGGLFLHMDFAKGNRILDKLFDFFVPVGVKFFYRNAVPYKYLVQSKQAFYTPKELENLLKQENLTLENEYNFLFSTISVQVFSVDT